MSTGNPTVWNWDFGDGGNSNEQNPVYTYLTTGVYTVSLQVETSFGCIDEIVIEDYIDVTTGISDEMSEGQINIYPNPTNGNIYIETKGLTGDAEVKVVNPFGIEIISETWNKNDLDKRNEFDMNKQYPGTYYLIIQTDNEKLIRKFIVL